MRQKIEEPVTYGLEAEDLVYQCRDCGEEFVFPARVSVRDLKGHFGLEKAVQLIEDRQVMQQRLNDLISAGRLDEAMDYQTDLNELEYLILNYSVPMSQEAYIYRGFTMAPESCPKCRQKRKAEAHNMGIEMIRKSW